MNQAMVAVAITAVVLSASGCDDKAASKAGGAAPPVTLRMGTNDEPGDAEADQIEEFARQVQARSHGQVHIEPAWKAAGMNAAGWDQVVARQVKSGELDMAMSPARAWDLEKVTSLRALQAPFLVDSDGLVKAVVTADLAGDMLAGLNSAGVTGLALVPESTRQVFSFGKPLHSPTDFRGVTVRAPQSGTTFALFRALGATPDDLGGGGGDRFADGVAAGTVMAAESSYERAPNLPKPSTAVGNLTLFSKINAVVVNSRRFAGLDETQRRLLREAAAATRDWAARMMPSTAGAATGFCRHGGTVVLATQAELAAFRQAALPVFAELERDGQTAAFIARIRGLGAQVTPAPQVGACGAHTAAAAPVRPAVGTFPDGVYRKEVSEQAILAGGASQRDAKSHAGLWTMTFDKGTFTIQQRGWPVGPGVYCVSAGRITAAQGRSRCGDTDGIVLFTATWQLHGDQFLLVATAGDDNELDDNEPPDPLTKTLFGGEPWTKIS